MARSRTHVGNTRLPKIAVYNHQTGAKLYTSAYSIYTRKFEGNYPVILQSSISQQEFGNLITFLTQKWNNEVFEKQKQIQLYTIFMFFGLMFLVMIFFYLAFLIIIIFIIIVFVVIQGKLTKVFNDGCKSMNTYLNEINSKTFQQRGILFKLEFDVAVTINGVPISDGVQNATLNNMQSQMAMQQQIIQQQQNQISMQQQQVFVQPNSNVPVYQQSNQMK